MFYDQFKLLCENKGVSCNKAALDMGLSNATPTKWKKSGATPSGGTLNKIADYFGVTVDYLLGNTEQKENTPAKEGERNITLDDFTYAMYEESKELTAENKQKLLEMAQFFKQQQEKEQK